MQRLAKYKQIQTVLSRLNEPLTLLKRQESFSSMCSSSCTQTPVVKRQTANCRLQEADTSMCALQCWWGGTRPDQNLNEKQPAGEQKHIPKPKRQAEPLIRQQLC